jgi:hypothetical protein
VYVGWSLLPLRQIKNPATEFGRFDLAVAALTGLVAAITFGLATAMAAGFGMYTLYAVAKTKAVNWVRVGSTVDMQGSKRV